MAIDAVIDAVKRHTDFMELWLRPRVKDGQRIIAGRRRLLIAPNPDYEPQTGDEIWGNASMVVISKHGTDHKFGRIMLLANGERKVLWSHDSAEPL